MATGLEAYDALKAATSHLPAGSAWAVNTEDILDLRKLTPEDLVSRGYAPEIAEEVSRALSKRNQGLNSLATSMGLHLTLSPIAQRLTEPKPSREKRQEQLTFLLQTKWSEVEALFRCFYIPGTLPPAGSLTIQTILDHEYINIKK